MTDREKIWFLEGFERLQKEVHANAKEKGFWHAPRNNGELIALVHSELSEALEALRQGNLPDDKIPAFQGAVAELADAVIRILDMAEGNGWPLASAILAKVEMNKTRALMHGKKF